MRGRAGECEVKALDRSVEDLSAQESWERDGREETQRAMGMKRVLLLDRTKGREGKGE